MRVVIIGPGKIGCGYLTPLFRDAGWEVVLAARTDETAQTIARVGAFSVRITRRGGLRTFHGVPAVVVGSEAFRQAVQDADLICTAVGVEKVGALSAPLVRALSAKDPHVPIDIWVVENQNRAPALERAVREAASVLHLTLPPVGFAGAVATVAVARGAWNGAGRPEFVADNAQVLDVDETKLTRGLPNLPGVRGTRHYPARLHEKLYVFNTGHALCAYLGWLRGHRTIDQAVRDLRLRPLVVGCLLESRRAVLKSYPVLGADISEVVAEILHRFGDEELADPVARVAREPMRKLAANDRLIGPARLIRSTLGQAPPHFALGIAGALLYRNPEDAQSCTLSALLREQGIVQVLREICCLAPEDGLTHAIASRYHGFILTDQGAIFPPVHENGSGLPRRSVAT